MFLGDNKIEGTRFSSSFKVGTVYQRDYSQGRTCKPQPTHSRTPNLLTLQHTLCTAPPFHLVMAQ